MFTIIVCRCLLRHLHVCGGRLPPKALGGFQKLRGGTAVGRPRAGLLARPMAATVRRLLALELRRSH